MKSASALLTILILAIGCDFKSQSHDEMMDEIREDLGKDSQANNAKILAWENFLDSLYQLAEVNPDDALSTLDNAILNDASLDQHQIYELHFVKGDIYYGIDSLEMAISQFNIAGQEYKIETPKILAARAGAFLKLRQYENARTDLYEASEINHGYLWNVGNFYEVTGLRDSAISCYTRLYKYDTVTYKYSMDRATVITKPSAELMNELEYRDRNRTVILMSVPK